MPDQYFARRMREYENASKADISLPRRVYDGTIKKIKALEAENAALKAQLKALVGAADSIKHAVENNRNSNCLGPQSPEVVFCDVLSHAKAALEQS